MKQVETSHYDFLAYANPRRFASYYHQLALILASGAKSVLEIGPGDGFIKRNLPGDSIRITTLDHDEALKPDVVGDVRTLPFRSGEFDVVCAFQVLEHLPFEQLTQAAAEIKRCAATEVLVSVPDSGPYIQIQTLLPLCGTQRVLIELDRVWKRTHRFDGQHYWEVGTAGHSKSVVGRRLECSRWAVKENTRLVSNPYHRFYVLAPRWRTGDG